MSPLLGTHVRPQFFPAVGIVLLAFSLAVSLWTAAALLWIEMQVPFYGDATAYIAAGRGIVNGLVPYRDLLEIKPPGIFLITAFSFFLSGDEGIAVLLRFVTLIGPPLFLCAHVFLSTRGLPAMRRLFLCLLAAVFAAQLLLFVVKRAGSFQTEAFGLFFASLYVLALADGRKGWRQTALLAALILCTVGLKEPFLLSLAGAALLLLPSFRLFWDRFLFPSVLATGAGAGMLALTGWLDPYLSIYLPVIFTDRIAAGDMLLSRGLFVLNVVTDITRYHPLIPWTGYAIVILALLSPVFRSRVRYPWHISFLVVPLCVLGAAWLGGYSYVIIRTIVSQGVAVITPQVLSVYVLRLLGTIAVLCLLVLRAPRLLPSVGAVLGALYLATLAAGAANFQYAQHYLSAIPVYVALFLLCIRYLAETNARRRARVVGTIVGMVLFMTAAQFPLANIAEKREEIREIGNYIDVSRNRARAVDALLDACGIDRYFLLKDWWIPAFTRHSPLDLFWVEMRAMSAQPDPAMHRRFFDRLARAAVIVAASGELPDNPEFLARLRRDFSPEPPPCAQGKNVPAGMAVF